MRSSLLSFVVLLLAVSGSRPRRHRGFVGTEEDSSEAEVVPNPHRMQTPPCDLLCDAQWKSDFQVSFGNMYDTSYFDIPLDYVILGSKQTLNSFCSITQQKFTCYSRECEMESIPWSAERHICQDDLDGFRGNINCMSKTSRIVRRECTDVCNNIPAKMSQQEVVFLRSLRLSPVEHDAFLDQNQNCHFAACHQLCHEMTVLHSCDENEHQSARELLRGYYDAFLLNDWKEIQESHHEKLYSSFCRRITKGINENSFVLNMTRYNNQQLDRIKTEVKQMLADL